MLEEINLLSDIVNLPVRKKSVKPKYTYYQKYSVYKEKQKQKQKLNQHKNKLRRPASSGHNRNSSCLESKQKQRILNHIKISENQRGNNYGNGILITTKINPKFHMKYSRSMHVRNTFCALSKKSILQQENAVQFTSLFVNQKIRNTLTSAKQNNTQNMQGSGLRNEQSQSIYHKKYVEEFKKMRNTINQSKLKMKERSLRKKAKINYEYSFQSKQKSFIRQTFR